MSAQVARNFFPVLFSHAESHPLLAATLSGIFPNHIQLLCPVPTIRLQGDFHLKWPTVAAACISGFLLCLFSGGHMLLRSANRKGFFTWGFALLWYGIMCLGGLFYHCIEPDAVFRRLDVIGTACSSISIVAGSILADDTRHALRIFLLALYASVAVAAVHGSQLMREVLYVGPTVAAFVAAAWFLWKVNCAGKACKATREAVGQWSVVAAAAAGLGVFGVACDKWLCVVFGSHLSMLFWFFVGCNVAIFSGFLTQNPVSLPSFDIPLPCFQYISVSHGTCTHPFHINFIPPSSDILKKILVLNEPRIKFKRTVFGQFKSMKL